MFLILAMCLSLSACYGSITPTATTTPVLRAKSPVAIDNSKEKVIRDGLRGLLGLSAPGSLGIHPPVIHQNRSGRKKPSKHRSIRKSEMFQDFQTFCPIIDFFPGVEVLYRQNLLGWNGLEPETVFRRRHAVDGLEAAGKISVIGKTGFEANIDHGFFCQNHQFPGVVEANGVHVILKGLVHGLPDKAGQEAQRAAL